MFHTSPRPGKGVCGVLFLVVLCFFSLQSGVDACARSSNRGEKALIEQLFPKTASHAWRKKHIDGLYVFARAIYDLELVEDVSPGVRAVLDSFPASERKVVYEPLPTVPSDIRFESPGGGMGNTAFLYQKLGNKAGGIFLIGKEGEYGAKIKDKHLTKNFQWDDRSFLDIDTVLCYVELFRKDSILNRDFITLEANYTLDGIELTKEDVEKYKYFISEIYFLNALKIAKSNIFKDDIESLEAEILDVKLKIKNAFLTAKSADTISIMFLSDYLHLQGCNADNLDFIEDLTESDAIDIMFGNEREYATFLAPNLLKLYIGTDQSTYTSIDNELLLKLYSYSRKYPKMLFVLTCGERGSIAVKGGKLLGRMDLIHNKRIDEREIINVNGAGDAFAAAMIDGLSRYSDMNDLLKYATFAAQQLLTQYGPRMTDKNVNAILAYRAISLL